MSNKVTELVRLKAELLTLKKQELASHVGACVEDKIILNHQIESMELKIKKHQASM